MKINLPYFPAAALTETQNELGASIHEWIVAFHDGPVHPEWWGRFTQDKFRHISLFTFTHGAWIPAHTHPYIDQYAGYTNYVEG